MSGIGGFSPVGQINPANFTTMRTEDNLAPKYMPMLLAVIANLGFPKPTVVVGSGMDSNPLQLDDYLSRAGEPGTAPRASVENYPVSIVLCWPEVDANVRFQAATGYQAFANDLWIGFGTVAAALNPGVHGEALRELAIKQMPELSQAFDRQLREIAERGLKDLK